MGSEEASTRTLRGKGIRAGFPQIKAINEFDFFTQPAQLIAGVLRPYGDLRQGLGELGCCCKVVLLAHNTRFHEEVSYNHKAEESREVKFYRIRKFSPEPNQIQDCGQKNPIRSAYQELWDEVADAYRCPDSRMPWLPNILRRILESYFSTLGGQGESV